MVPAILDAISDSEYAAITEVVPDEADPYCARAAEGSGATILTSDSDLLVYDLGDCGAVAFFSSLELKAGIGSSDSCSTIDAAVCRPRGLARQLGLKDLQRLAFEIKEDPSLTFLTALGLARLPASKPAEVQAFIDQYQTEPLTINCPSIPPSLPTYSTTHKRFLDPQTSEFLLQATSNPQENLCFYLPTLLDSPPKTSAWTPSTPLRFLAYSYALASSPKHHHHHHSVSEYTRKGARITPSPIPLLSTPHLISCATALATRVQALKNISPNVPTVMAWRLFALHETLIWCSDAGKPSPSRSACMRALTGTAAAGTWMWEDLHLSAQIQAVLYSLRMLEQTLAAIPPGIESTELAPVQHLSVVLSALPPLAQLLASRLELAAQVPRGVEAEIVVRTVVVMLRGRTGGNTEEDGRDVLMEDAVEAPAWEEQKRRKGRKRGVRGKEVGEKGVERGGGGNLFTVLDCA